MKVPNRNSAQTPSETYVQYPCAPNGQFVFIKQNGDRGARNAAVW